MILKDEKILVLGAFSWLGYVLINELKSLYPNCEVIGTFHVQKREFPFDIQLRNVSNEASLKTVLFEFKPVIIINFLRGEDIIGLSIHSFILSYAQSNDAYYLYSSSILALEGYKNRQLTEDLMANGISPYASFKSKCEQQLYDSKIRWCIIRFSSVQGFVPHKITRNEFFLQKLESNEKVLVDRGVVQNRMLATLLITGIIKLIVNKFEGIYHFGTLDSSEEYVFLQKQAELFGYSKKLVVSGKKREINLVCVPDKAIALLGNQFKVKEIDTLNQLANIPEFKKYKR